MKIQLVTQGSVVNSASDNERYDCLTHTNGYEIIQSTLSSRTPLQDGHMLKGVFT